MRHFLLPLFLLTCANAQSLSVTAGVTDDQVLQRGSDNGGGVSITGSSDAAGGTTVEVRVLRKHLVLGGFDWQPFAKVAQGQWSGTLGGLPAGGPYRIELRTAGSRAAASVNNVLVGDLWLLAGQSNMQGVGDLIDVEQPHDLVHNLEMSDRWVVAEEPLHTLANAVDRVHWPWNEQKQPERYEGERLRKWLANRKKGAGLGLPFATEMIRRTGVPIGLLSCAHGGTSMDQWDPALKDKGGDSLYGSMLRRVRAAGGKVKGVLWYQGESDAGPEAVASFRAKFERFVAAVRQDFGQPDLPFYFVQIGRHLSDSNVAEWNSVQESQRLAESSIAASGMAPAVDLALDDGIHVGTQDLKRLGKRLANLALGRTKRGPRPVSATLSDGIVRVVFSEVNGRLVSDGRISGFSIHDATGQAVPRIYKTVVDPADSNAVLLYVGGKMPEGATLRYGAGKDPYCNLRDEADMAAPVFGPLAVQ